MPDIRERAIAPADQCAASCRPRVPVRGGRVLGIVDARGGAPCPRCVEAFERAMARRAPRAPRRRSGPGRVEARWDETIERIGAACARVRDGASRLLWFDLRRWPAASGAVAAAVCSALGDGARRVVRLPEEILLGEAFRRLGAEARVDAPPAGCDLIVAWGADPLAGSEPRDRAIRELRSAGARLVAVDPRAGATARAADLHLAPLPGHDAHLMLALAARGPRLDAAGPADWCARAGSTPLASAAAAGAVPLAHLERLVDELASARAPVLLVGRGIGRQPGALDAVKAALLLAASWSAALLAPDDPCDPSLALALPPGAAAPRTLLPFELDALLPGIDLSRTVVVLEGGDPARLPGLAGPLGDLLSAAELVIALDEDLDADLALPAPSVVERVDLAGRTAPPGVWHAEGALPAVRGVLDPGEPWRRALDRAGLPAPAWLGSSSALVDAARRAVAPRADRLARASLDEPPSPRPPGESRRTDPERGSSLGLDAVWADAAPETPRGCVTARVGSSTAAACGLEPGGRVLVYNERGRLQALLETVPGQPDGVVALEAPAAGWPAELARLWPAARLPGEFEGVAVVGLAPPGED
ncbi:MAG: hypothetical protein D6738_09995 [Acidobacteria bacterium]|nr:MAG: hypothetical protein D6738_09995 [Acidobacteriota bacterium]